MSTIDYIIAAVLAVIIIRAVFVTIKSKKNHGCGCGCCSDCHACSDKKHCA